MIRLKIIVNNKCDNRKVAVPVLKQVLPLLMKI